MKRISTSPTVAAAAANLVLPEQLAQQAADAVCELLAEAAAANTTTGVNPTYQTASDGLLAEFSLAKVATANDMSGHQQNLQLAWILALLLGLFGAGAAWFGIAQRLREYR